MDTEYETEADNAVLEKVGKISRKHGGRRNGAGRKAGVPNKLSGDLKSMILDALGREGGISYLRDVAREDRKAFCALLGRVLPMTVVGDPEQPLMHAVEITIRDPNQG